MGYRFSSADIAYLRSAPAAAALAEVAELDLSPASQLRDVAAARRAYGDRSAALIETVRLRRRAVAKLSGVWDWLFTDDALQQATPTRVARHRAERLAGRAVHDVTCSIGADLVELARTCSRVVGSDLDPTRLAMAQHNLTHPAPVDPTPASMVVARPGSGLTERGSEAQEWRREDPGSRGPRSAPPEAAPINTALVRADALVPCTSGTVIVADPARRADGRRTYDPAKLQPPLPDLLAAYPGREMAVKCAPGLNFDRLGWVGEVEVVSLDGAVREACLWSPGLTEPGVTRRASVLTEAGAATVTDAGSDDIPVREPGEWIVDPDGAVVRAGLVRQYAAEHGLWQLDPRIAYLTGDRPPAGIRAFRVVDRYPYREKALRAELRRRDCGPLEILLRGVDIDPDALRRRLKPAGAVPYTVVITRIGSNATVFLCTAERIAQTG